MEKLNTQIIKCFVFPTINNNLDFKHPLKILQKQQSPAKQIQSINPNDLPNDSTHRPIQTIDRLRNTSRISFDKIRKIHSSISQLVNFRIIRIIFYFSSLVNILKLTSWDILDAISGSW